MGKAIIIPGADFSQSGIITSNFIKFTGNVAGYQVALGGSITPSGGMRWIPGTSGELVTIPKNGRVPLGNHDSFFIGGLYQLIDDEKVFLSDVIRDQTNFSIEVVKDSVSFSCYDSTGLVEADFSSCEQLTACSHIFGDCENLTSFKQPNKLFVGEVGSMFENTTMLSLDLSNLNSIGTRFLNGSLLIEHLNIDNLVSIYKDGTDSFIGCSNLVSISVKNVSSEIKQQLISLLATAGFTFVEQNGVLIKRTT